MKREGYVAAKRKSMATLSVESPNQVIIFRGSAPLRMASVHIVQCVSTIVWHLRSVRHEGNTSLRGQGFQACDPKPPISLHPLHYRAVC
jgi:hypothetical protein